MTSALCRLTRFGELTPEEGKRTLSLAQTLGVQLATPDNELMRLSFDWTIRLDRAAAYDSFSLALAEVLQCDLWTADQRLYNAVNEPWVRWIGIRDDLNSGSLGPWISDGVECRAQRRIQAPV